MIFPLSQPGDGISQPDDKRGPENVTVKQVGARLIHSLHARFVELSLLASRWQQRAILRVNGGDVDEIESTAEDILGRAVVHNDSALI